MFYIRGYGLPESRPISPHIEASILVGVLSARRIAVVPASAGGFA